MAKHKAPRADIYRSTKCFTVGTNGYPGGFPRGFLKYLQAQGWWGAERVYLCGGGVKAQDPDAITVDIKSETNPDLCEDATQTSLPDSCADCVIIDPPYSKDLAHSLYGTAAVWKSINAFTREAARLVRIGGVIVTLTYEIPKQIDGYEIIAVVGVYQIMNTCNMRCLTVFRRLI